MWFDRGGEIAGVGLAEEAVIDIGKAHKPVGHSTEDAARGTAKELRWKLKPGNLRTCEACAAAKAKQKICLVVRMKLSLLPKKTKECIWAFQP